MRRSHNCDGTVMPMTAGSFGPARRSPFDPSDDDDTARKTTTMYRATSSRGHALVVVHVPSFFRLGYGPSLKSDRRRGLSSYTLSRSKRRCCRPDCDRAMAKIMPVNDRQMITMIGIPGPPRG
jgi:hypothetical protein